MLAYYLFAAWVETADLGPAAESVLLKKLHGKTKKTIQDRENSSNLHIIIDMMLLTTDGGFNISH